MVDQSSLSRVPLCIMFDLDAITKIVAETPEDFAVYSGDDSLTLPALSVGARGIVSVASHII